MKQRRITYSADEMGWLEQNRSMVISDFHAAFIDRFGRQDVTAANLHGLRKRLGWKVGRAKGRTAGRIRAYSADEIVWLRENSALSISEYQARFVTKFDRDVSAEKLHALRKRMNWKTGRTGRFLPGQPPANKGKSCPPGVGGRSTGAQRTQFKKGDRTGRAQLNYRPIGYEMIRGDGFLQRKINDDLPMQKRWRFVHLIRWEEINGPLPKGHCLKCLDGDKTNTDPSNWQLVHRGVLARLNGGPHKKRISFDEAAPELKPTLMAMAQVEQKLHTLRKAPA